MKKIFSLSIIAVAVMTVFASCEKQDHVTSFTCTCTLNQHLTPGSGTNQSTQFGITDATTNNALSKCNMHMEDILNHSGQSFTCKVR